MPGFPLLGYLLHSQMLCLSLPSNWFLRRWCYMFRTRAKRILKNPKKQNWITLFFHRRKEVERATETRLVALQETLRQSDDIQMTFTGWMAAARDPRGPKPPDAPEALEVPGGPEVSEALKVPKVPKVPEVQRPQRPQTPRRPRGPRGPRRPRGFRGLRGPKGPKGPKGPRSSSRGL